MSMEDYPWEKKRTSCSIGTISFLSWMQQIQRKPAESDTLKSPLMLANWQGDPDSDFCGSAEQTLSVPSGFSLDVLAWQRPRVTRSAQWGFWLGSACMAPSFSSKGSISRAKMPSLLLRLKMFSRDFWKKYYIHKENSKTNSTRALRNLLTSEHNKVHSTQNGCDLRQVYGLAMSGSSYSQMEFLCQVWVNSCKNGYQTVFS